MQSEKKTSIDASDSNRIAKVAKITWEGKNLKAFDAYKFEW